MQINRYSNKEPLVFVWVMAPYVFFMNWLMFGNCIFSSLTIFFTGFGLSIVYFVWNGSGIDKKTFPRG